MLIVLLSLLISLQTYKNAGLKHSEHKSVEEKLYDDIVALITDEPPTKVYRNELRTRALVIAKDVSSSF